MDANKMKNHRYHFINEDYIVSLEEHQYILNSLKQGKTQIILREGKLILNLSLGFAATETDKLTDDQEIQKSKTLKLEGQKYIPPTPLDIERRKKMMEDWKQGKIVKEIPK